MSSRGPSVCPASAGVTGTSLYLLYLGAGSRNSSHDMYTAGTQPTMSLHQPLIKSSSFIEMGISYCGGCLSLRDDLNKVHILACISKYS